MKIEIISPRQMVVTTSFFRVWQWDDTPGAGFHLPCNEQGVCIEDERRVRAEELDATPGLTYVGLQEHSNAYMQAAVGRCGCGAEVVLSDALENECEACGQFYNMLGQRVHPTQYEGYY